MRFMSLKAYIRLVALLEIEGYKPLKKYKYKRIFSFHEKGFISTNKCDMQNLWHEDIHNRMISQVVFTFINGFEKLEFIYERH